MGDISETQNLKLLDELKDSFAEVVHEGLGDVIHLWETIYGTNSEGVVHTLATELKKQLEDFWKQQSAKLQETRDGFLSKIYTLGNMAVTLEKALGLEPQVEKVPNHGPLVYMEEQLNSLLETYQEMKTERLKEYFQLKKKEQELCAILDKKTPKYKIEDQLGENNVLNCYVPTADDITEFSVRIIKLEKEKEQMEYELEDAKCQLRQLMAELDVRPLSKIERFAVDEEEFLATRRNLNLVMSSIKEFTNKKEQSMAEADHLRDQIDRLSKKMFKDADELEEFLENNRGFSEQTINRLKEMLKKLKEERKANLTDLITNSRKALDELWDKCCFTEAQRKKFAPYYASHKTEEVLEIHELEIEELENFYNQNKKLFTLAGKYEKLWERLLQLEDLANNKDRLFNNRGGCLLKEEKERKVIQKKVPAIKEELLTLLNTYKEETGKDFLLYGEPLQEKIELKERQREMEKYQERLMRKNANNENMMIESRLGCRPVTGCKRKAAMTPQENRFKTARTELTTVSSASKSTVSSKSASSAIGTLVQKEKEPMPSTSHLTVPMTNYVMRTPARNRIPAASTPQNGTY